VLTSPWIYLTIIALCRLARETVRLRYRHRAMVLLLEKTHDPSSLKYLVQLEEVHHPWLVLRQAEEGSEPTWPVLPGPGG
jgi:hypothetical protein